MSQCVPECIDGKFINYTSHVLIATLSTERNAGKDTVFLLPKRQTKRWRKGESPNLSTSGYSPDLLAGVLSDRTVNKHNHITKLLSAVLSAVDTKYKHHTFDQSVGHQC